MSTWPSGSGRLLNVAATCRLTRALGPGPRAVVWVQGRPFDRAGCVAPDRLPDRPARLVMPAELATELCSAPGADADAARGCPAGADLGKRAR
ncbi:MULTISPECIES: hypothetical protein [Protofrankia]|uniref:Uncharacterized protein n=1 Tax=Candidatus Protofrankia datiscae TaxID=2716812 RepID=F8AX37_9ACTN|nr:MULTISPECIES: hypothetical protein [Protofrankia]AEH11670.1 hypothetical protein FsymDg_4420 [Candidatus Protofrankia datiscae]